MIMYYHYTLMVHKKLQRETALYDSASIKTDANKNFMYVWIG